LKNRRVKKKKKRDEKKTCEEVNFTCLDNKKLLVIFFEKKFLEEFAEVFLRFSFF
jgi:hypothetical protein